MGVKTNINYLNSVKGVANCRTNRCKRLDFDYNVYRNESRASIFEEDKFTRVKNVIKNMIYDRRKQQNK